MDAKENSRTKNPDWKLYLRIIVVVSIVVVAITSFRWLVDNLLNKDTSSAQISVPPTPVVMERGTSPNMDAIPQQVEMHCLGDGKVDYSIFALIISGGFKPYEFQLENMASQVLGPFPIEKDGETIRLKVYGGETVLVKIWSFGSTKPDWTGIVSVPPKDPYCAGTPVPSLSPTFTVTLTFMPTSTTTSMIGITNSPSKTPKRTTNVPATATLTNPIKPSDTPEIHPSSTSLPEPSKTAASATDTPVVIPSKTPIFIPSDTPKPIVIPTITPFNANPKECEDGQDNDGDGLTDYPQDPDCDRPGDPHEDH
jgi:hypothetical protein